VDRKFGIDVKPARALLLLLLLTAFVSGAAEFGWSCSNKLIQISAENCSCPDVISVLLGNEVNDCDDCAQSGCNSRSQEIAQSLVDSRLINGYSFVAKAAFIVDELTKVDLSTVRPSLRSGSPGLVPNETLATISVSRLLI
jgi:hypothetical protein